MLVLCNRLAKWQMAGKLGDFFMKKFICSFLPCSQQGPHFFHILVSYESFDMWLCGKSEKKNEFFGGMGSLEDEFPKKITKKVSFLSLKLQKSFCLDKAEGVP